MKAIKGHVLIKMNVKQKEKYALTDDIVLEIKRGFNFNLREDRSSLGIIVDGNGLTPGVQCLTHHLAIESGYDIQVTDGLTEEEIKTGYAYFSIPIDMVFCTYENDEWVPCKDFLITLRIFEPYTGKLVGIGNQRVENRMWVVKGNDEYDGDVTDISGQCYASLPNCDYEIIYNDDNGKEYHVIRTRHREITARDFGTESRIKKNELLLGLNENDCKTLKEINEKKHSQDTAIIQ